MLSALANQTLGGESTMPGDYESWPGAAGRMQSYGAPQPMVPSPRTPFPRLPTAPPSVGLPGAGPYPRLPGLTPYREGPGRTPFPRLPGPGIPPYPRRPGRTPFPRLPGPGIPPPPLRPRRRRPRPPPIALNHRRRRHVPRGRPQVIIVPFDHRPTLGLRRAPRHTIEIERVRCHRRRRSPSLCYDYDYDDDYDYDYDYDHDYDYGYGYDGLPAPPPIQPNVVVANPHLSLAQSPMIVPTNNNVVAASAFLTNLTQETIDRLPKHIVHLPTIHLPGSQADVNTELNTIILPAEIINPIDGTLSILQTHPGIIGAGTVNIQPTIAAPIQPHLINLPSNIATRGPVVPSGIIPATVGVPIAPVRPALSPAMASDPFMQRFQELFQRLNIPPKTPILPGPNPSIIRPAILNMSEFNPVNSTANNPPIIAPLNSPSATSFPSLNNRPSYPASVAPKPPTSFPSLNSPPSYPASVAPKPPTSFPSLNSPPSYPASVAPKPQTSFPSLNSQPSYPASVAPTFPTPYRSSAMANNATYRADSITPSISSDVTPYSLPNTTSYTTFADRSNANPIPQYSTPSKPTPRTSFPSLATSSSFSPSATGTNTANTTYPSSTPNTSTPRSILRNTPSTDFPKTTYTRLDTPDFLSPNDTTRKTARFS